MTDTSLTYPPDWKNMKVALVHDWLTGMRGGEKCLELLGAGFPHAPLFCLLHKQGSVSEIITRRQIHTSWLQHIPGIARHYRYFLPAFPLAIHTIGKPDADLLISTSHCAAKALPVKKETRHLCYCFTPMRYAWTFHDEYFGASWLKRAALAPALAGLRSWDKANSAGVNRFVAISRHVQKRIETFYGREADVVYPPADTDFYTVDDHAKREDVDLVVSALVPYKRIDLVIKAYNQSGRRLKVVGTGTEFNQLKAQAGPRIEFLGWQSDETIRDLYRTCRFLLFPGEEDFGIVPVEAQACGMPVIAFGKGGVTETVLDEKTGLFFHQQTAEAIMASISAADHITWNTKNIRLQAEKFSQQAFIDGMDASIRRCLTH